MNIMLMILDDGNVVRFGQNLGEVENLFSCHAIDSTGLIARKSIDRRIDIKNASLEFDSGLLSRITFKEDYQFINPPTPYPEPWKNFPVIGSQRVFSRIPRDGFLSYLAAWEERADQ